VTTGDDAVADEIKTLLDAYGPLAPTLLPWLSLRASGAGLLEVALVAASQAELAAARRWPVVTDAVAELLAGRATELDAHGPELAGILPQLAAYVDSDRLADMVRRGLPAEAACYAGLTHPSSDGPPLLRSTEPLPADEWRPILAAARERAVPPLANLPLLAWLVSSPLADPGDLAGWDAAYLLPYLRAGSSGDDSAEAALAEAEDYAEDDNTCWYAAAICARAAPYLDEVQRARVTDAARTAPPAWRPVLRELAGKRKPWPTAAAELAAAHPALARLNELASRTDPAALAAACALIADHIDLEYGAPARAPAEIVEQPSRDASARRILRPGDDTSVRDWLPTPIVPGAGGMPASPEAEPVRHLVGQCPDTVPLGEPFSLLVQITTTAAGGVPLKPFAVPAEGTDVLLVAYPHAGLRLRSGHRVMLRVPAEGNSERVMFELLADSPGARQVDVTAWLGGTYLGELTVEVTAERDARPGGPSRPVSARIDTERAEGMVTLVVRYEPAQNLYRFEFRDEGYPDEVEHRLSYEPGPQVERLIAELEDLTKGRAGYSPEDAREVVANTGMALWKELLPEALREQFWERRGQIQQLTILAKNDTVPWELLYPQDRGKEDDGFLVEQFPVTRWVFGRRPTRTLRLGSARFVLPSGSPPEAQAEIDDVRAILGLCQPPDDILRARDALLDVIKSGNFGLLHFACHNNFDPSAGSSITFDQGPFRPVDLTRVRINEALAPSAPLIFINACRAAGLAARYNQLDGWAHGFLEAGAAAFIGSLWAIEDTSARVFAATIYAGLQEGKPLGDVVVEARKAAARGDGDPTWLAYSVYGDPGARKGSREGDR
jgi:CHAT domain-containing protein